MKATGSAAAQARLLERALAMGAYFVSTRNMKSPYRNNRL
jgi:hypothetical protein